MYYFDPSKKPTEPEAQKSIPKDRQLQSQQQKKGAVARPTTRPEPARKRKPQQPAPAQFSGRMVGGIFLLGVLLLCSVGMLTLGIVQISQDGKVKVSVPEAVKKNPVSEVVAAFVFPPTPTPIDLAAFGFWGGNNARPKNAQPAQRKTNVNRVNSAESIPTTIITPETQTQPAPAPEQPTPPPVVETQPTPMPNAPAPPQVTIVPDTPLSPLP
jgi:hypothetical protein